MCPDQLEAELNKAKDEIGSQKAALEKAWGDEKDLKRMISEMTAEHGSLLNQLDEDKALTKGLEGIRQVRRRRGDIRECEVEVTSVVMMAWLCRTLRRERLCFRRPTSSSKRR